MPLVLAAYLSLVAGMLLAFAGTLVPTLAVAGAALGAAALRRDARWAGLALVAAAGALAAHASSLHAEACGARAGTSDTWIVALEEPAGPGGLARGRLAHARCALRATLLVDAGVGDAGDEVAVRGVGSVGTHGLHVRDAIVAARAGGAGRDRLAAWRWRVGTAIDTLFGPRAPLVRALVVADARRIPEAVRDRFADAGLVHALSVSGLHVAIVAAALALVLRAARCPPRAADALAVLAVAGYVALLGAPAPAVRAAGMLALDAFARHVQRPTSPWAVLALASALPLLEPATVRELGYQLSVAGMAALVAGRRLAHRLARVDRDAARGRPDAPGRLAAWRARVRAAGAGPRATLVRELVVGTVAALVTAPLVAWHFGQVSVVGPLANLAAAPVLALLQPTLFLAVLAAPVNPLATFVAGAAAPLLDALDAVARVAAAVPGAAWAHAPTALEAALAGGAALALLVACAARRPARPALAGGVCAAAAAWAPLCPARHGGVGELHLLDVGQGDAVALRTPRGRWVLVDAGRAWRGGDAGARTVVPWLRRRGGDVALLVLTHPHADHVGGAATVLRRLRPPEVWDAGFVLGSAVYRDVLAGARAARTRWRRVAPGDSLALDGIVLTVLAPDSAWTASLDDPNAASVVVSARYGRVRFLLTGDAEAPEEAWLLARARDDPAVAQALRADVLKVAHHGSATSSTPEFLAAVRPRVALVSVGGDNPYGHPHRSVVARLRASGAAVLRTDRLGAVVLRTDGRELTVDADGTTWRVPTGVRAGTAR